MDALLSAHSFRLGARTKVSEELCWRVVLAERARGGLPGCFWGDIETDVSVEETGNAVEGAGSGGLFIIERVVLDGDMRIRVHVERFWVREIGNMDRSVLVGTCGDDAIPTRHGQLPDPHCARDGLRSVV